MLPDPDDLRARMTERYLRIGEVAERAGLSLRTVRYYEQMGLLMPADRTEGGFRLYTEDHVDRLELIKEMKPLGFSVQEIRELLDARDVLFGGEAESAAEEAAAAVMREYSALAAERVDELRRQLARAETFAKRLRRHSKRRSKRAHAER